MRDLLGVIVLVTMSGCIVDGIYAVRGTVRRNDVERTPIAGAAATVRDCRVYPSHEPAVSDSDGKYRVQCWIGGMCILFWCPGMGIPDTTVEFAAPGYRPRLVRLRGKESDPLVSRARCGSPNCVQIDVTLEPETSGSR